MANRKKCLNKCFFKWFDSCALFRGLIVQIIRLRLGHSITSLYLHKIGLRESLLCVCDSGEVGDLDQFFLGCERTKIKVDKFFQSTNNLLIHPTVLTCSIF